MKKKSKKNNNIFKILSVCLLVITLVLSILFISTIKRLEKPLPKPKLTTGIRGSIYGIDDNINEKTIDNYLDRTDTVYRDVRMLVDPANWEAKGGDRFLSGYIRGFEVIPYAYLGGFKKDYIAQKKKEGVSGLYEGETLFSLNKNGEYEPNYEESMSILEEIFPKDKNIIIVCGAGGYAGETKKMLVQLGWDENKIYNMGGYWFYEGKNNIKVKYERNGKTFYNFAIVPYHDIDFNKLHEVEND